MEQSNKQEPVDQHSETYAAMCIIALIAFGIGATIGLVMMGIVYFVVVSDPQDARTSQEVLALSFHWWVGTTFAVTFAILGLVAAAGNDIAGNP